MSVTPRATQGYAEGTHERVSRVSLSLIPEETDDGRVVLRCMELPISGSGDNRQEALSDLFEQFYLHLASQAYDQRPVSFMSGLASLWDFAGFGLRGKPVDSDVDACAAAADWYTVGRDLATAMQRFDSQIRARVTEDVS